MTARSQLPSVQHGHKMNTNLLHWVSFVDNNWRVTLEVETYIINIRLSCRQWPGVWVRHSLAHKEHGLLDHGERLLREHFSVRWRESLRWPGPKRVWFVPRVVCLLCGAEKEGWCCVVECGVEWSGADPNKETVVWNYEETGKRFVMECERPEEMWSRWRNQRGTGSAFWAEDWLRGAGSKVTGKALKYKRAALNIIEKKKELTRRRYKVHHGSRRRLKEVSLPRSCKYGSHFIFCYLCDFLD